MKDGLLSRSAIAAVSLPGLGVPYPIEILAYGTIICYEPPKDRPQSPFPSEQAARELHVGSGL